MSIVEKLAGYRALVITRDAIMEAPSLFAIISFFLTGDLFFLAFTGLVISIFFYTRPAKEKAIKDLSLSTDELMLINDDNSILN